MFGKYLKTTQLMAGISFSALLATMNAAKADVNPYIPTLPDSVYQLSFLVSDGNDYNVVTYEENGNQWDKVYYKYSYQITGCTGSVCSSNNRINSNQNGADLDKDFYGLRNSAIDNTNRNIGTITGDFLNNQASRGGAIYNNENNNGVAQIGDLKGDFINNHADAYGGAIANSTDVAGNPTSTATIGNITGNFIGNSSNIYGGAIYNNTNSFDKLAKIGDIKGNFIANSSEGGWGGAIYNNGVMGNITGDFISNSAEDGGAMMNTQVMGDLKGNFIANTASGYGGALYLSNYATMGNIEGKFIGNTAVRSGGAIFNSGTKDLKITADFIENHGRFGGALFNSSNPDSVLPAYTTLTNSSFINNSADKLGGAIYHEGEMNLTAAGGGTSLFQGNTANGVSNAIYVGNDTDNGKISTVNLIATNDGSIIFYDDIDGDEGYKLKLSGDNTGEINFHADIHNGDIIIGEEAITRAASSPVNVSFDDINNISNKNNSFIMNDGVVDFDNFALTQHNFRELKFAGGEVNINNVDADLDGAVMGRFKSDTNTGGDTTVKVHNVNVVSDGGMFTALDFADTAFSGQVENHVTAAAGPVYNYVVNYLPGSGQYTFQRDDFSDAVIVPSYAAVAAVSVLSDEIYSRVLSDADSYFTADTTQEGWKPFAKVFGSDDNTDLKHFAGGDSKFYGVIAGVENNPAEIGSGWKAVYNVYGAYAKGEHKYASQRINQDTGYIGASGIFYKDNFFVGSTLNAAIMQNNAKASGEKNKFSSYLGGIGLKTGYNYDLGADYVIQPNLYGSYTYINSHDYKTERNANVEFDDMHNFELAPGLKLSKEFAEGLALYLKGRYVFIFNENQHAKANDIALPDVELKNYAEFGLGIEKEWLGEGMNMFLEITRREGGREGWNGLAGAKWDF